MIFSWKYFIIFMCLWLILGYACYVCYEAGYKKGRFDEATEITNYVKELKEKQIRDVAKFPLINPIDMARIVEKGTLSIEELEESGVDPEYIKAVKSYLVIQR